MSAQMPDDGLADEDTPFIRDAWYVACFSEDLQPGRPFGRKILGENVVLYRTADGRPVAMKDRCPHRSFPLSASKVDGDDIVCGYHGIRYGSDGACKHVPTQPSAPRSLQLKTFVIRETAPLVWIWMGDSDVAANTHLPPCEWATEARGWALSKGLMPLKSNYVFLHENLLDLSHLTFLHEKTFGTPDYARAPFSTERTGDVIAVKRVVSPTRLPAVYANPLNIHGDAARIVTSTYYSPGFSVSAVILQDLTLPEAERPSHHIRAAQLVTPRDRDNVHYYFVIARDFVREDAEITQFIHTGITAAFAEDRFALESIARIRAEDADRSFRERSVSADRAGVYLRRHLRELADREQERVHAKARKTDQGLTST